ncbi:hypothetical protein [Paludibacter sp.]|uniref:hypothetical protein n=1 Tax=Paludibacter sp. TaxID=1898105 RepID=UPI0025D05168|nr:hypothetical protein [Paludibacter sp.]
MELSETVKIIPAAIIGLTIHEFAHAYTAYRLGDNTAKDDGRISQSVATYRLDGFLSDHCCRFRVGQAGQL